jgi:ribose/xylose/arabinose/galactoside ABC-type transport system permease subunit
VVAGLVDKGTNEPLAIAVGCLAGIGAAAIPGFINGVIIAKLRIPSFIVTLGMSFIARGVAFLLSGGNVVAGQPQGMRDLGNEALLYLVSGPDFTMASGHHIPSAAHHAVCPSQNSVWAARLCHWRQS